MATITPGYLKTSSLEKASLSRNAMRGIGSAIVNAARVLSEVVLLITAMTSSRVGPPGTTPTAATMSSGLSTSRSKWMRTCFLSSRPSHSSRPKSEIKAEKQLYSEVKRARWILLAGENSLSDDEASCLRRILDDHAGLALCHAMKEEMARLFDLRDGDEAGNGWTAWFEGAKASGIPALVRFAELKEKRIDGLIAHASHPISTGKLEGFNNRIKVAKRIAYGYRDEDYFFSLIQFISIPSVRAQSHRKT